MGFVSLAMPRTAVASTESPYQIGCYTRPWDQFDYRVALDGIVGLKTVGPQNFRLWYDPGHSYYYSDGNLDPADDATTVDGLVVGMSVKDFVPPKEVMVTPGDAAKLTAEAKKTRLFLEALTAGKV